MAVAIGRFGYATETGDDTMSVYVDALRTTLRSRQWPFQEACHMIADSLDELHAMAETIGLRRGWFQKHAVMPHYDLTPNKRKQAVHHGAIEINAAQMVAELQKRRFHASDNPDAEWDVGRACHDPDGPGFPVHGLRRHARGARVAVLHRRREGSLRNPVLAKRGPGSRLPGQG